MGFSLIAPATVEEALSLVAGSTGGTSRVLAGGTDLLRDLDDGRGGEVRIVSLRRMPWRTLAWAGDALTIGSTLPLRALDLDASLRTRAPGLWTAVRAVGGVALRQRATLGGNVARASPTSDLLPILLAYSAQVHLVEPNGSRDVPLTDFVRGLRETDLRPGELIESVTVPAVGPSAYVWQRVRPANDISQVGVAVARPIGASRWHIALGGVVPKAVRLPGVEEQLQSVVPSAEEIASAARDAATQAPFVSDKRATESYRRHLVEVLVGRALTAAMSAGSMRTAP